VRLHKEEKLLTDHYLLQKRKGYAARWRRRYLRVYGKWLETLQNWNWFTTFTFRNAKRSWAVKILDEYFCELERAAQVPIAWVLAEEFGEFLDHFHVHALIAGVGELSITTWEILASVRFGRCEIKPFIAGKRGAHYIAKAALNECGDLHFGGTLAGNEALAKTSTVGRDVIAHSAGTSSSKPFHQTLGRRRKR
jgi:hypothetical protein